MEPSCSFASVGAARSWSALCDSTWVWSCSGAGRTRPRARYTRSRSGRCLRACVPPSPAFAGTYARWEGAMRVIGRGGSSGRRCLRGQGTGPRCKGSGALLATPSWRSGIVRFRGGEPRRMGLPVLVVGASGSTRRQAREDFRRTTSRGARDRCAALLCCGRTRSVGSGPAAAAGTCGADRSSSPQG